MSTNVTIEKTYNNYYDFTQIIPRVESNSFYSYTDESGNVLSFRLDSDGRAVLTSAKITTNSLIIPESVVNTEDNRTYVVTDVYTDYIQSSNTFSLTFSSSGKLCTVHKFVSNKLTNVISYRNLVLIDEAFNECTQLSSFELKNDADIDYCGHTVFNSYFINSNKQFISTDVYIVSLGSCLIRCMPEIASELESIASDTLVSQITDNTYVYEISNQCKSIASCAFNLFSQDLILCIPDSVQRIGSDLFINTQDYFTTVVCYNSSNDAWNKDCFISANTCWYNAVCDSDFIYELHSNEYTIVQCITSKTAIELRSYCGDDLLPITHVAKTTFIHKQSIQRLHFSSSIKSIATGTFMYCSQLAMISVSPENEFFTVNNTMLCSKDGSTLVWYAIGSTQDTLTILDDVKEINSYAFYNAQNLERVHINPTSQLKSIGDAAFKDCTSLQYVGVIPSTVEEMGSDIFENTNSNFKVVISQDNNTTNWSPDWSNGLTSDQISDTPVVYDDSIDCQFSIYETQDYAILSKYDVNSNITHIELPEYVTYVGKQYKVTTIGTEAFANSGIQSVTLTSEIKSLENAAFKNCKSLQYVYRTDGLEFIGNECFSECSNLNIVAVSGTDYQTSTKLRYIGNNAFYNTDSLSSFYLGTQEYTYIGSNAFTYSGISNFVYSSDELTIKSLTISDEAFSHMNKLNVSELTISCNQLHNKAFYDTLSTNSFKQLTITPLDVSLGSVICNEIFSLPDDHRSETSLKVDIENRFDSTMHIGECILANRTGKVFITGTNLTINDNVAKGFAGTVYVNGEVQVQYEK